VPPLRSRPEDIEFLTRRFLDQTQRGLGCWPPDITQGALDLLRAYPWPGNVRQLRNVVRRACLMASGKVTAEQIVSCLPNRPARNVVATPNCPTVGAPLRDQVEFQVRQVEHDAILHALAQAGGNKTAAARLLNVDSKTFRVKLKIIEQQVQLAHGFTSL
jgi:two-component system, NtrC family, response regulator AtoC